MAITRTIVSALLILWPLAAGAESPDGQQFTIDFSGSQSVWNPGNAIVDQCTTECVFDPDVGNICAELCLDLPFAVDAKGKLSGNANLGVDVTVDGVPALQGDLRGALKGKLSGKAGSTSVKLNVKVRGTLPGIGPLAGEGPFTLTGRGKFQGNVNSSGSLTGTLTAKACVKGLGCENFNERIAEQAGDGDWTVTFAVNADSKGKLTGTAVADTSGGPISFAVKGKYNSKKDESSITLKARGSSIKLKKMVSTGDNIDRADVSYKVVGHNAKVLISQ